MKGSMTPVFVKLNFSHTTFSKYLQCCHWCNRSCNNITQVDNVEKS